ncbi:TPA: hypothetical protein SAN82_000926 [Pseudomonas putida]|nr:hypothetical protein [Pseudomonas putida]
MADLCSEYDAVNLFHYLHPKREKFSSYFAQYLDLWFTDERNHANGFFELNRLIFDSSEEHLIEHLKRRNANFENLEKILSSEFSILLMFAYDEYASVKTYKKDTFYSEFGHPLFNTWIKNLIADEAVHFGNAIKILKNNHAAQLNKAEEVLLNIISLEHKTYQNTFLFDHDGPHFLLEPTELGDPIIEAILSALAKGRT